MGSRSRKLFSDSDLLAKDLISTAGPSKKILRTHNSNTGEKTASIDESARIDELLGNFYKAKKGKENRTPSTSSIVTGPFSSTRTAIVEQHTPTSRETAHDFTQTPRPAVTKEPRSLHNLVLQTSLSPNYSNPSCLPASASTPAQNSVGLTDHLSCEARMYHISQRIQTVQNMESKRRSLVTADYGKARMIYSSIHEEFDINEKYSSATNHKVALLLITSLREYGYCDKDAATLAKMNFRRLKESARPKSEKEERGKRMSVLKRKKLNRRKKWQTPQERNEYPLIYELMSSEDEESVWRVPWLTDSAKQHITELDRRSLPTSCEKSELVTDRQINIKTVSNKCVSR